MKLLLLFMISACYFRLDAQKLKLSVDKETGDSSWTTTEKKLFAKSGGKNAAPEMLKSSVYRKGQVTLLDLFIQTGRTNIFSISEGQLAVIELHDGTRVELRTQRDARSRTLASWYGGFLYVYYQLAPEIIRQLRSSPLSRITIQSSTGEMEYDIDGKASEIIMKQLILLN